MKNATSSLVNLITLFVGIVIGLMLAPKFEKHVSAQQAIVGGCVDNATVSCISPIMTVPSAGIGILLSNHIAADQLTVNGYDVLKLQNNMLTALVENRTLTVAQANALVSASHPDKAYKFKARTIPTPPPAK